MAFARLAVAAVLPVLVIAGVASAKEPTNLTGEWKGSGFVQKDDASNKIGVRCEVVGNQSGDEVGFSGICRAMLVVRRSIGADIVRNGTDYTGTYVGSLEGGVAQLNGTRVSPNRIVLEMTFERAVNGDDKAEMIILTDGNEGFSIETRDRMENGATVVTSSVDFRRK